jgi:alpha-L-rhamnosidase
MGSKFFSHGQWIWNQSDRLGRHYTLGARQLFKVKPLLLRKIQQRKSAFLEITADAYYQVWLNGEMLGHGPAKSAEGERMVDRYDVADALREGANSLEILVWSLGYGTMNYCLGEAGLIFELRLPGQIVASGPRTWVRHDGRYRRTTVRRWIMPGMEDFHAAVSGGWRRARVVEKKDALLPRPIGLPAREPIAPQRLIALDIVRFPNFSTSFRVKPYLVSAEQVFRSNQFQAPAFLVTDLISTRDQELRLVPTAGQATWYFQNKKVVSGSGWWLWDEAGTEKVLRLSKGANRLVGILSSNQFDEIHLAGFAVSPIQTRNPFGKGGFQIIRAGSAIIPEAETLPSLYDQLVRNAMFPEMVASDTLPQSNFQDLAVNASRVKSPSPTLETMASGWKLPATDPGKAVRLILDLGSVRNGWLSFKVRGRKGSRVIFSLFEALEYGPPLRINWPETINNAIRYRLKDGPQKFESFFAYGARYIAIYHEGDHPVQLEDIRLLTANCGGPSRGAFRSNDPMLNAIYSLCEQTVHSATDDTLTDCPTYEAVNWNFDNRLGAMADLVTFRNLDILRHTIELYVRDPRYPALVRSQYPSTWDNRIPAFSFHWIIFCHEFYLATGDEAFVRRIFPQVARGLEEALSMIDETGLMRWPQEERPWHIVDWHAGRDDNHLKVSAEQALLLGALAAGKSLAQILPGAKAKAWIDPWERGETLLRASIHRQFWDPERDAYADSIHEDGALSQVSSQPSNSALAYYGVGTPLWRGRLAKRLSTGGDGLLTFGSPMGLFYVMEFLDQAGQMDTIFHLIRERWGPMVLSGDKTVWEHFPEFGQPRFPTRSRCHPFATYILKYYVKYLFGLEPFGLGARKFRFEPRPPASITGCEGVLPLNSGSLRVKWRREGGRLAKNYEAPTGIRIVKSGSSINP